jgi:hypothetical protein
MTQTICFNTQLHARFVDPDPIQPRRARFATECVHRFVNYAPLIGIQNP